MLSQRSQQLVGALYTYGKQNECFNGFGGVSEEISKKIEEPSAFAGIFHSEQLFGLVYSKNKRRRPPLLVAGQSHFARLSSSQGHKLKKRRGRFLHVWFG